MRIFAFKRDWQEIYSSLTSYPIQNLLHVASFATQQQVDTFTYIFQWKKYIYTPRYLREEIAEPWLALRRSWDYNTQEKTSLSQETHD